MNADRLLANFDTLVDTPGAVPRLRRFILDLAVRGKLVPQDPNDEPVSELLKRNESGRSRMIEQGEIRKPRDSHDRESLAASFDIPPAWRWVRLRTVGAIVGGGTPDASDATNFADPGTGFPWLTPADLGRQRTLFIARGARDLTQQGLQRSSATRIPAGSVLFTSRAPVGYVAIALNPLSTNQGFKSVVPYVEECSRFIAVVLMAFAPEIDANAPGTTFREVSGKIISQHPFPLPPLAEQHRIVAKVDELMTVCDRLKHAREKQESARDRFTATSFARLSAADRPRFRAHAVFTINNFDRLTARSDQISALRRTIIDLAVRGRLVPQDPTDEPAQELLERIAEERDRLMKIGETRKLAAGNLTMVRAPFSLPDTWRWAAIGDVFAYDVGIKRESSAMDPSLWLLELQDIEKDTGSLLVRVTAAERESKSTKSEFRAGDILYGKLRPYLNKVLVADDRGYSTTEIVALRPYIPLCARYCALALRRRDFVDYVTQVGQGTKMPRLRTKDAIAAPFPLPPLAEQHRIVAMADELMTLCDRLEERVATTEDTRIRLLDAVLHEALESHG